MPMTDQREIEDGDGAPVDVLASLFDARGWDYEFVSDEEILGDAVGTVVGGYQMARGVHFLSHTLLSACLAWLICVLMARVLRPTGMRSAE